MKHFLALGLILVTVGAFGQQRGGAHKQGLIYGVAIGQDGKLAEHIGLAAWPEGLKPGDHLPQTRTNNAGEYRFAHLPLGKYTVFAYDNKVGYDELSTGKGGPETEVELTPGNATAQLLFRLPPRAAFLQVHVTNRNTGAVLPNREVRVVRAERPDAPLFVMETSSKHAILIPSDMPLLLHVTVAGFLEWEESVGTGKLIDVAPGNELTLDVRLEPVSD